MNNINVDYNDLADTFVAGYESAKSPDLGVVELWGGLHFLVNPLDGRAYGLMIEHVAVRFSKFLKYASSEKKAWVKDQIDRFNGIVEQNLHLA